MFLAVANLVAVAAFVLGVVHVIKPPADDVSTCPLTPAPPSRYKPLVKFILPATSNL